MREQDGWNSPMTDDLAEEIIKDLEAGLESFREIMEVVGEKVLA